jgi:hypothetical protein
MNNWQRTSIESQNSGPRTFGSKAQSAKISTVEKPSKVPAASQNDSVPAGTARHEPGPAQKARRKANSQRDGRTDAGTGKQSVITS